MDDKKKNRGPNYMPAEKELLTEIVYRYKDIVENKKTNATTTEEKNKAWIKIASEFNAQSPNYIKRSEESLKAYYKNQKELLKKKVGNERKNIYLTGGGPGSRFIEDKDELLLSIVNNKTVYGLNNTFDSDSLHLQPPVTIQNENCLEEAGPSGLLKVTKQSNQLEFVYESENDCETSSSSPKEFTQNAGEASATTKKRAQLDGESNNNCENSSVNPDELTQSIQEKKATTKRAAQSIDETPNKKRKINIPSRRRPIYTVKTMTSSHLGEMYKKLIEKKMELAQNLQTEHEFRLQAAKEEHALKMELLRIEIKIKKKEASGTNNNI